MDEMYGWLGPEPEEYKFYGGQVTLYYDDKEHSYTRLEGDDLVLVPGVTSACGIVDKSAALMQWASNMCADHMRGWYQENTDADFEAFLAALEKARFAHRDHKEHAADIGHIAHAWIEQYIKNELSGDRYTMDMPENRQAGNGCIAALDWMRKHKVKWLHTERKIYSRKHDYAGTMDGLAFISSCGDAACCGHWVQVDGRWVREALHFENKLAVIDWKTSNDLHMTYEWQTAGYDKAVEEEIGLESEHPELTEKIEYRVVTRLGKEDAKFEAKILPPDTLERDFAMYMACLALYRLVKAAESADKLRRKEIRRQAKEDRDEQRKIACVKSSTFQGYRYPKCNDGPPCEACLAKWRERHPDAQSPEVPADQAA